MLTLLFNEKYCKQAVIKGEMSNINGKYYFLGKEIYILQLCCLII